jgi:hypothetical protein
MLLTRHTLASAAGAFAVAPWTRCAGAQDAPVPSDEMADAQFRELDERIDSAMVRYHVPGAAVGVFWHGREHGINGHRIINVRDSEALQVARMRLRGTWPA